MDNNITLRKAQSGDVEQIKTILFSSLNEYGIVLPENYTVSDIDSIDIKNSMDQAFVLVRDNSVIGFVLLKPHNEDFIELKRLYLTSTERGHKLGKFLLVFAINFAKENNYKYIRLETTSKFKEAVSLYRKFGFKEMTDVEKSFGHDLVFEKSFES